MTNRRTSHRPAFARGSHVGMVVGINDESGAWRAEVVAVDTLGDVDVVELLDGEDELPEGWKGRKT